MPAPQNEAYFLQPKKCATCKVVKPVEQFYTRGNTRGKAYRSSSCTACCRLRNYDRYDPEKAKQKHLRTRGSPKALLVYFRNWCRSRSKENGLSDEEFLEFRKSGCFYCDGALPQNGVGLDRIDNSKGYLLHNVVPCCTTCNRMRGDHMSPEELYYVVRFLKWMRSV